MNYEEIAKDAPYSLHHVSNTVQVMACTVRTLADNGETGDAMVCIRVGSGPAEIAGRHEVVFWVDTNGGPFLVGEDGRDLARAAGVDLDSAIDEGRNLGIIETDWLAEVVGAFRAER